MKKGMVLFVFLVFSVLTRGQDLTVDSSAAGTITVNSDPRLDLLEKKEYEFNSVALKSARGYRLLVLSTNDRELVMNARARLLQMFPEQKVYMIFQAPYIKLKFGNFTDKTEAERYKDMLSRQKIITTNIYVVPEAVEVKPDKPKDKEEE